MTRGVGLSAWRAMGLLDRELEIYRRLPGVNTTFFHDELCEQEYKGLRFLPLSRLHVEMLDVVKSNQVHGAARGLKAARLRGIPFVLRCGYSWARFEGERPTPEWRKARALRRELLLAQRANLCVVASANDAVFFRERYGVDADRVVVQPNWVDTDMWRPLVPAAGRQVVSVGRLSEQKDQRLLIDALAHVSNSSLLLVGAGALETSLAARAQELGVPLEVHGVVPHAQLREVMSRAAAFALTSRYEGAPKVVIEAMALGLPVVATDLPGVAEIIEDGISGRLVPRTVEGVAAGLNEALSPSGNRWIAAARARVESHYSLRQAVEREIALLARFGLDQTLGDRQ